MCKHYDEGDEAILAFVRKTSPWIWIPEAFAEAAPPHMYPKRKGRIVRQREGQPQMVLMRWGVWPFYQKEKPELVTNARSETLMQKRLWKESAKHRRCLIPATGYFEAGLGPAGARGEVQIKIKNRPCFFMAGLWDHDPDPSSENGECGFTLVTTEPNELVRPYNDRMPVLLSDADAQAWIGDEPLPESRLAELCRTFPADSLTLEEVATPPREKLIIQRPTKKPPKEDPNQQLLF